MAFRSTRVMKFFWSDWRPRWARPNRKAPSFGGLWVGETAQLRVPPLIGGTQISRWKDQAGLRLGEKVRNERKGINARRNNNWFHYAIIFERYQRQWWASITSNFNWSWIKKYWQPVLQATDEGTWPVSGIDPYHRDINWTREIKSRTNQRMIWSRSNGNQIKHDKSRRPSGA